MKDSMNAMKMHETNEEMHDIMIKIIAMQDSIK